MLQSIYTHAGCDNPLPRLTRVHNRFNPHTHAGCDNVHNVSGASFPVSIHTPTQGVTFLYICNVFRICFNPHTHAGCDFFRNNSTFVHYGFNPHTHAGCDTISFYSNTIILCFNPHTHAGCDSRSIIKITESKVSIHTPTQGVTRWHTKRAKLWFMFQSTHPRRV